MSLPKKWQKIDFATFIGKFAEIVGRWSDRNPWGNICPQPDLTKLPSYILRPPGRQRLQSETPFGHRRYRYLTVKCYRRAALARSVHPWSQKIIVQRHKMIVWLFFLVIVLARHCRSTTLLKYLCKTRRHWVLDLSFTRRSQWCNVFCFWCCLLFTWT